MKDQEPEEIELREIWWRGFLGIPDKHGESIKELLDKMNHLEHEFRKIMIAQATLDASLTGLTGSVNAAVAALATNSSATSTPDTSVAAYQAGVDAQTVALAAATPPVVTPAQVAAAAK